MNSAHEPNPVDEQERLQLIYDREKAEEYRVVLDERYAQTYHSNVITGLIRSICPNEKSKDFSVLDLGCGTGRYFKAMENVGTLTGVDISIHMVEQAKARVSSDATICQNARLECGNVSSWNILESSHDLIISIGTLGEYCPLSRELIDKAVSGLRPGGIFLFTVFDADHNFETRLRSMLSKEPYDSIFNGLYPLIPERLKRPYSRWFFSHYLTKGELRGLLSGMDGINPRVKKLKCPEDEWDGTHLIVLLQRPSQNGERPPIIFGPEWESAKADGNGSR